MKQLIFKLHEVLNLIKGFDTGYSSSNNDEMVILQDGKLYKAAFELIKEDATFDDLSKEVKSL